MGFPRASAQYGVIALLLVRRPAASIRRAGDVDGGTALLDVNDLALLIDDERSAVGYASIRHQDAVCFGRLARCEIAEKGERQGKLLCKLTKGRNIIRADSEDLNLRRVELGDTSLVSCEFLRSATGEGGGEECHHHRLLPSKIGKLEFLALLSRGQFKIGRRVSHLEGSLRRRSLGG